MENKNIIEKYLAPLGEKIGNQKHFSAIASGVMMTIPFTMAGALINIIVSAPMTEGIKNSSNPLWLPLKAWYNFSTEYHSILSIPYNMTMGMIAIIVAFAVAMNLAKSYKLNFVPAALTAMIMFIMVVAPSTPAILQDSLKPGVDISTLHGVGMLETTYLGAQGMFLGIIIALLSVEITRLCKKYRLEIRMPDSVPQFVSDSFSSIIPVAVNIIVLFGADAIIKLTSGMGLPQAINAILAPSINGVSSIWGILILFTLAGIFWIFGIHGHSIFITTTLFPISIQAVLMNSQLYAQGQEVIYEPILAITFAGLGGAGCTMALAILMSRSKSKQLNVLGKASFIPGLFNINEPIIFGAPVVFNPLLAIPFIVAPIISFLIAHFTFVLGLVTPYHEIFMGLPIIIMDVMNTGDLKVILLDLVILVVTFLIYWPFFKVYERKLLSTEKGIETEIGGGMNNEKEISK